MNIIATIAFAILVIIIIVAAWYLFTVLHAAFGQQANDTVKPVLPPSVAPTVVPTATPTSPNPNFQYLPQKAYVQAYGPEIGIPSNGAPLQSVPVIVQQPQTAAPPAATPGSGFSIDSILPIVIAAGSGLLAKMGLDKAKKVETTSKENAVAIVDTKVVQQEIAKYMFDLDKAKADALNNAPAIKLESLEQEKKKATETAAKA